MILEVKLRLITDSSSRHLGGLYPIINQDPKNIQEVKQLLVDAGYNDHDQNSLSGPSQCFSSHGASVLYKLDDIWYIHFDSLEEHDHARN